MSRHVPSSRSAVAICAASRRRSERRRPDMWMWPRVLSGSSTRAGFRMTLLGASSSRSFLTADAFSAASRRRKRLETMDSVVPSVTGAARRRRWRWRSRCMCVGMAVPTQSVSLDSCDNACACRSTVKAARRACFAAVAAEAAASAASGAVRPRVVDADRVDGCAPGGLPEGGGHGAGGGQGGGGDQGGGFFGGGMSGSAPATVRSGASSSSSTSMGSTPSPSSTV